MSSSLSSVLKSCSEGELVNELNETKMTSKQLDGSRLRRTFTLPRNPFGAGKISFIKSRTKEPDGKTSIIFSGNSEAHNDEGNYRRKLFRRPSWKRFINKIAQQLNSTSVNGVKCTPPLLNGERVPCEDLPWPAGCTPAATGLNNHGNTCFMNAVLQCLSHTDVIAEYFVLDYYKMDLLKRNKLNSKKYGTRGEVTEQLATVLKALWACQYTPDMSQAFKAAVERHGTQYKGNSQHDAQEFLFWLLDKVHEDLNTATKKKYKTIKNSCGRPDEVVAEETLANHARRNSSFVQAVFQAQYRSALTCARCMRTSCTFDPFHCVSVQLPQRGTFTPLDAAQDITVPVTVVYVKEQPRQVRLGVEVAAGGDMARLRQTLLSDTCLNDDNVLLTEISDTGWHQCRVGTEPAGSDFGALYCIETPTLDVTPTAPYVLLLWINLLKINDKKERFGSPYAMQVPREISYQDLQKLMLKEMANVVEDCVLMGSQASGIFKARVAHPSLDASDDSSYLQPELAHPLYALSVEAALGGPADGPPHLKLELEWLEEDRDSVIWESGDACEVHNSAEAAETPRPPAPLTLHACLTHYTRAETLAVEDAWRCPQCQQYMPVVKTLGLWSLPDILVIHLKRFRQLAKGRTSTKLTTMVDFPLDGFDMTPHLAQRGTNNTESASRSPRQRRPAHDNTYDLYAVCYHHGDDLETGHYTAACRNPYDGNWYKFDDSRVTRVEEDDPRSELVNNTAYMLFYQRRKGSRNNNSSATSSTASSDNVYHWALCMARFIQKHNPCPKSVNDKNVAPIAETNKVITVEMENCMEKDDIIAPDVVQNSSLSHSALSLNSADMTTPNSPMSQTESPSVTCVSGSVPESATPPNELNGNVHVDAAQDINRYESVIRMSVMQYPIHKDVHVNPKMTGEDRDCVTMRPRSVDYPRSSGVCDGDINRNYDSSPFVSSINGVEYCAADTNAEVMVSVFGDTGNSSSFTNSRTQRPMSIDQVMSPRLAEHNYPRETAGNVC